MADNIRATPRNPVLGLFSDITQGGLDYLRDPRFRQSMMQLPAPVRPFGMGAVALPGLFESTGLPKTLERAAYGEPLTNIGMANVPTLKPETADAMMTFAPMIGPAIRATKGLPVGMGIKDVGKKNIDVSLNEVSNFLSAKSEFGQVGGTIRLPDKFSDKPYLQINYAEVEKASRGLGKGKELYQSLIDEAQARGLRVFSDSTVEKQAVNVYKSLGKKDYELRDMTKGSLEDGSVYGAGAKNPAFEILPRQSLYPQQAALDLAQQRAALPVSQGGLGLPAGNTAEQRAAAMGFDTDAYHGTTNNFDKFVGRLPTYAAEEPRIADIYANATSRHMSLNKPINAGPNIMPLKLGGKEFTVSDLGEGGGGWFRDNLAQALGISRTRNLINELPNYGIDRLKVTDMGDLGGVQTQHMIPSGSDNIRSRFAAFDPFRRSAAIAATMGVAAPDLLANELDYPSNPMYTDPLGYSIR